MNLRTSGDDILQFLLDDILNAIDSLTNSLVRYNQEVDSVLFSFQLDDSIKHKSYKLREYVKKMERLDPNYFNPKKSSFKKELEVKILNIPYITGLDVASKLEDVYEEFDKNKLQSSFFIKKQWEWYYKNYLCESQKVVDWYENIETSLIEICEYFGIERKYRPKNPNGPFKGPESKLNRNEIKSLLEKHPKLKAGLDVEAASVLLSGGEHPSYIKVVDIPDTTIYTLVKMIKGDFILIKKYMSLFRKDNKEIIARKDSKSAYRELTKAAKAANLYSKLNHKKK